MDVLDLSRLQFAITTIYHFLFVPVSIGLSLFVASCQTLWLRTGKEVYDRMTRFWGKLFLISFALGVVTGIVQEFQFGMNWSGYSRYVGDVFGAPLAMEALAAFFVESTFIGLWIFGRDKLPAKAHAACAWMVALGTMISAWFILAANSWMQDPHGYHLDPKTGHAVLDDIGAVLFSKTTLFTFGHTILAAWATAGMVVVGVAAWMLARGRFQDVARSSMRLALPWVLGALVLTMGIGHFQGQHMTDVQPMKMAAAEALFDSEDGAGLSLFATGDFKSNPGHTHHNLKIPNLLSFMATNDFDGTVKGINQLNAEYRAKYGPGEYAPPVAVAYWSFRIMIGAGVALMLLLLVALWRERQGLLERTPLVLKLLLPAVALPVLSNSSGWMFTEMGRQPWVVQGLLRTEDAVSPSLSAAEVWISLVGFTLLYGVLALIGARLFARTAKAGPEPTAAPKTGTSELVMAY